ncbi:hypothetical protein ACIRPT_15535 [Streptomyces sp. NPDC101227]
MAGSLLRRSGAAAVALAAPPVWIRTSGESGGVPDLDRRPTPPTRTG